MIKTWGQTPKQLFNSPHQHSSINQLKKSLSSQFSVTSTSSSTSLSSQSGSTEAIGGTGSIHRRIMSLKWGTYVGSLEQSRPPVCVWKESCRKNIVSLVSLASNEVIGLSQYKCLLLERAKDSGIWMLILWLLLLSIKIESSGLRMMGYTDTIFMAVIEWNSYDDHINIRTDPDKLAANLIPIRANENVGSWFKY